MVVVYNCPLCNIHTFSLIKQIRHIGLYHGNDATFAFTCGLNGCAQVNKCFSSYRSHVYRKHRDLLASNENGGQLEEIECNDDDDDDNNNSDYDHDDGTQSDVPVHAREYKTENLVKDLKRNLCLFILKLREKHCVPSVVHTDILEDLKVIFQEFTSHFSEALKFHLQVNLQINVDEDDDLAELISQNSVFEQCIREISSEWMLQQYCTEELGYISPVQLKMNGENPYAHLQYIPLQAQLTACRERRGHPGELH